MEVIEYFKERPQDFLIMDLFAGDGYENLFPFLGRNVLKSDFPHANKTPSRDKNDALDISVFSNVNRIIYRKKFFC